MHDLALVVHSRDAWEDTVDVLRAEGVPERIVMHCFTGGPDVARRCLDLGAYLSFSGIVTFKNAVDVRDALELCPLERLLVETDAPFLAPVPHRGEQNKPAWVALVGEAVAQVKSLPVGDVLASTVAATRAVFEVG
jgi:TatD DNase family protein